MSRRNKNRLNVNVNNISFTIQNDRQRGIVELDYNVYENDVAAEGLKTRMVVVSCWMNNSTGNAIKAHLAAGKRNPMHVKLIEHIKTLGLVPAPQGNCLTTDGQFIRYGTKPGNTIRYYDPEVGDEVFYYDSKAKALKEILAGISSTQTIGGLNLISLNRLPDNLLIETGFTKVEDLMKERNASRGIPMWLGNPAKAIGIQNEWRDREGAAATRRQFLALLNRMLS